MIHKLTLPIFLVLISMALHSQPDPGAFQSALSEVVATYEYPGAVAAYEFRNGRAGVASAGLADVEGQITMKTDHRMLAGSVGKTFVSAIVLLLESENRLSYDDLISKWLGDEPWFDQLPNANDITVSHLLSHTSGLMDHVRTEEFAVDLIRRMSENKDPADLVYTPAELISFLLGRAPLSQSGESYSYTDSGYILLGMIIEKITGKSYYDCLKGRILEPLKLNLTSPSDQVSLKDLASGYLSVENPFGLPPKIAENGQMRLNPGIEWTGGGLISNPGDLVHWANILYGEELMDAPYLDDLLMRDQETPETYYGYGVQVRDSEDLVSYGHGGWFPGYRTQLVYFPKYELALCLQINSDVNISMRESVMALLNVLID